MHILLCTAAVYALTAPPAVTPDPESIVANRLVGQWAIDGPLSKRLSGKSKAKIKTLAFESDASVAGRLPARLHGKLKSPIYLAGWMTINGSHRFPFILVNWSGSPKVIFFEGTEADPFNDAESFYLMLAQAKEPKSDLLFVGGDFARESFIGFTRR